MHPATARRHAAGLHAALRCRNAALAQHHCARGIACFETQALAHLPSLSSDTSRVQFFKNWLAAALDYAAEHK